MKIFQLLLMSVVLVFLESCQFKQPKDVNIISLSPYTLYNLGLKELEENNYTKAASLFENIFFEYPTSEITADAELMQAYVLYLNGEYDKVLHVLNTFCKLHSQHSNISYAYYLKAMTYYIQISDINLDQSKTKNAKDALEEVISRYQDSEYALDAALKINLIIDHLAGKEMLIGLYYLNKNNPVAAIRRFQNVTQEYNKTTYLAEALYRLVESNLMLGLMDEAKNYDNNLVFNDPNNKWTKLSHRLLKQYAQTK